MTSIDLDFYKDKYVIVVLIKKDSKNREKKIRTSGILKKTQISTIQGKTVLYGCGEYYFAPEHVLDIWNIE